MKRALTLAAMVVALAVACDPAPTTTIQLVGASKASCGGYIDLGGTELEPKKCGKKLGERPDWMSPDQYDPCRCDLPEGHPPTDDESGHSCGHIRGEKP